MSVSTTESRNRRLAVKKNRFALAVPLFSYEENKVRQGKVLDTSLDRLFPVSVSHGPFVRMGEMNVITDQKVHFC